MNANFSLLYILSTFDTSGLDQPSILKYHFLRNLFLASLITLPLFLLRAAERHNGGRDEGGRTPTPELLMVRGGKRHLYVPLLRLTAIQNVFDVHQIISAQESVALPSPLHCGPVQI